MLWIGWLAAALASPTAIVAVGDGLVVEEPATEAPPIALADMSEVAQEPAPTVAGGWVAVLADCLEERRPGQYALVDRTAQQPTAAQARSRVGEVREMAPALVIVGVGIPGDTDRNDFRASLSGLVSDLRASEGPDVLLVGPIPPALEPGSDEREQGAVDRKARLWNDDVGRIASGTKGASHLDLLATWPEGAERAGLTIAGRRLSDQGQARVGAQVCDAVLAWEAPPR